jgi:hypothetical protein
MQSLERTGGAEAVRNAVSQYSGVTLFVQSRAAQGRGRAGRCVFMFPCDGDDRALAQRLSDKLKTFNVKHGSERRPFKLFLEAKTAFKLTYQVAYALHSSTMIIFWWFRTARLTESKS